ncbi:carboxypeptidase-like regulatory domain-containing protein [Porphyromonas asaccharolytica]
MLQKRPIKKLLHLAIGLFLWSVIVSAQTNPCQLSGVVMDSVRHEAIAYATIEYKLLDEQLTGGVAANEEGHFQMTLPRTGSYQLTIRSVGFQTKEMRVTAQAGQNSLDTIYLAPDAQTLDEVQVVARRKLIKLSPKGLTYDMKNDVLAQTDNLLFALRKVPLVTVDGEGNIRVKGSSNFSV